MRLCLAVLVGLLLHDVARAKGVTVKEYEELAAQVQVLSADGIIYRLPHFFEPRLSEYREMEEEAKFLALAEWTSLAQFEKLLKHADPKVRTLALAGLFYSENPQALPLINGLIGDEEQTFSMRPIQPQGFVMSAPREPVESELPKQTVGQVAGEFVKFYLEKANYRYKIEEANNAPGFTEYWQKRKARAACASWFAVRLKGAMHGGWPPSHESRPDIERIRKEIDALPGSDGPLTLLWLQKVYGETSPNSEHVNMLVTRKELIRILQKVDRAQLWRVLKKEKFSDDPDLEPIEGNPGQDMMVAILFEHVRELFKAEDASSFLEMGQKTSDPRWWVAASELKPDEAVSILQTRIGFKAKGDEASLEPLMLELWQVGGPEEKRIAVDWYYAQSARAKAEGRQWFLPWSEAFLKDKDPAPRQLLAQLLEDKRAEMIPSQALAELAQRVNDWSQKDIVSREDIQVMEGGRRGKGGPYSAPQHIPGVLERLRASIPQWREI